METTDMAANISSISIRHELRSGDLGYLVYRHGVLYAAEYQYGLQFESYVASGLYEFYKNYDPSRDRMWICEHEGRFVGSLTLMHRPHHAAQLRYFLIEPEYRGIGLGKKLMELYMDFFRKCGYRSSYLWTTNELKSAAALYTRYGFVLAEEKDSKAFGKPVVEQQYEMRGDGNRRNL